MIHVVRGSSGLWGHGDEPLPRVDVRAFRGASYEAARSIGATVDDVTSDGVTSSFHTALITAAGVRSAVLCHEVLPVVAFTASPPQAGAPPVDFVSPPAWAAAFERVGFRLLDVGELSTPLGSADIGELAEAELEQVRYWRPGTVGELMFNWWD